MLCSQMCRRLYLLGSHKDEANDRCTSQKGCLLVSNTWHCPHSPGDWKIQCQGASESLVRTLLCICGRVLFPSRPKKRNVVSWHEGTEGDKVRYCTKPLSNKPQVFRSKCLCVTRVRAGIYGDQERALEPLELEL